MKKISFYSAFLLTACVTINIYFPAAAAEKVADEIIKGIQTEDSSLQQKDKLSPQSHTDNLKLVAYQSLEKLLNIVISQGQAADADLSVDTSEIRQLRSAMQSRYGSLKPFYDQGLIGIQADGFLLARGAVALKDRNKVSKLIAAENTDRRRLYQAIANANGHPEWLAQISATFATRWISNAQVGWHYQGPDGSWKQK